jgi:hypothetical protein
VSFTKDLITLGQPTASVLAKNGNFKYMKVKLKVTHGISGFQDVYDKHQVLLCVRTISGL